MWEAGLLYSRVGLPLCRALSWTGSSLERARPDVRENFSTKSKKFEPRLRQLSLFRGNYPPPFSVRPFWGAGLDFCGPLATDSDL